ncbi:hypothetical protein J1N35_009855 [Gossypium stocksii]|uniref:Uncharacterized protein n=1 Tax=Gossypium stocksii TaxID=47602 RepID=A0A9D3VZW0_9ROSI|nr:hypothetical protein J1N35_009855 [Gossypium stocksii]
MAGLRRLPPFQTPKKLERATEGETLPLRESDGRWRQPKDEEERRKPADRGEMESWHQQGERPTGDGGLEEGGMPRIHLG